MRKLKLFIENFIVYGISGVISKLIPLIMVPVLAWILPKTEYLGLSDLCNTIVQFSLAVAVMGLYDAMFRMFFEDDTIEFKKKVCSTALLFTLANSIVVFVFLIIISGFLASTVFQDIKYQVLVIISAITMVVNATNTIISAPTRMQNKRKVYVVTNFISPLIAYGLSIPMIMKGWYTIALPISALMAVIILVLVFWVLNKEWFSFKSFDYKLLKQLLVIGIPIMPSLLIYWVFNSSDRIMISSFLGVSVEGVYSVASKMGHISQLIYTAFAGGWQYFAFSTMKESEQVETNSKIQEYLGIISFSCGIFVCAISSMVFKILFPIEYYTGYSFMPFLFIAPLLQMLYQVSANQFLVIKKTWPEVLILSCGAIINIIMNLFLIPVWGIEGAAVATLFGYIISNVLCDVVLVRMGLAVISKRFMISCCIMVAYLLTWRLVYSENTGIGLIIGIFAVGVYLYLYRKDLSILKGIILKHKKGDKG